MRRSLAVTLIAAGIARAAVGWERLDGIEEAEAFFAVGVRPVIIEAGCARAGIYWESVRAAARAHGVPEGVMFGLAMAESAFNPFARSSAGAEGMFQFMPQTGAAYGLASRTERRSVARSADAAGRHLRDLYDRFADWALALAAYNAGAAAVERAIERAGTTDWHAVRSELPAQAHGHVVKVEYLAERLFPRFLAGAAGRGVQLVRVTPGDTWWALSRRHGVPVRLLHVLNGDDLIAGAAVAIPVAQAQEPGGGLLRVAGEEETPPADPGGRASLGAGLAAVSAASRAASAPR